MSKNHNVKQKTLFQAWNKKDPSKQTKNNNTKFSKTKYNKFDDGKVFNAQQVVDMECIDAIDLTDDDLIEAAELMESTIALPGHSNMNRNEGELSSCINSVIVVLQHCNFMSLLHSWSSLLTDLRVLKYDVYFLGMFYLFLSKTKSQSR